MHNILLNIKTVQLDKVGNENDVIELCTEGKYYKRKDSIYLVYEESEISGLKGTTTTIKIKDSEFELKRRGAQKTSLIFKKGKRYSSQVMTPGGNIGMEIITDDIISNIKEEPIYINIKCEYSIALKGLFQGKNIINIKATSI